MKRHNIIAALILICIIIIAPARSVAAWTTIATPREFTEIGAAVVGVNGNVTTFRDRNGGTWVHDNFTATRDYYMLVVDNMGTSFPYDDIIISLSED